MVTMANIANNTTHFSAACAYNLKTNSMTPIFSHVNFCHLKKKLYNYFKKFLRSVFFANAKGGHSGRLSGEVFRRIFLDFFVTFPYHKRKILGQYKTGVIGLAFC